MLLAGGPQPLPLPALSSRNAPCPQQTQWLENEVAQFCEQLHLGQSRQDPQSPHLSSMVGPIPPGRGRRPIRGGRGEPGLSWSSL